MDTFSIEQRGKGDYLISGELNFATVPDVWARTEEVFNHSGPLLILDFAGITRSDSAALALLLEWMRWARSRGHEISYQNLPAQLLAVAEVSGVLSLLCPQ